MREEKEELSELLSVAPGDSQKSLRAKGIIFKKNEAHDVEVAVTGTVVTKKSVRKFRGDCIEDKSLN